MVSGKVVKPVRNVSYLTFLVRNVPFLLFGKKGLSKRQGPALYCTALFRTVLYCTK